MLNRIKKANTRWALVAYDAVIFAAIAYIFIFHYHGGGLLHDNTQQALHTLIAFLCIFGMRMILGIYQQIWRYGGVQCYLQLIVSDAFACMIYMLLDLVLPITTISISRVISIIMLDLLCALTMRMLYRYAYKCGNNETALGRFLNFLLWIFARNLSREAKDPVSRKIKIAIVGAGKAGVSLAESLLNNQHSLYTPVCFIDISAEKVGRTIHTLPVMVENDETFTRLKDLNIAEIVLALPQAQLERKKSLYERYKENGFSVKIYDEPDMREAGKKPLIREIEIEELLFRPALVITDQKTEEYYRGKTVLVTGGGGSIGSELSRQIAAMKPKRLILLDIYENGVYDLQQELKMSYGTDLDVRVEITSIADQRGLETVFRRWHPQIVINAAAHKHVPLMEHNCIEAIENNIFGTLNVVRCCEKYHADRFMMLSTDKAVNPTNVMGATKRMCEMIMQAYSTVGKTRYSATRFGNVLGSAGSVIPLFKKQIAAGGPITLTDKRIIRYFMTIPEASQLVLQSGAMAQNGELFVLDMGQPVRILDLAENMIRLSGLRVSEDIKIIETGLRPGEKLYEELLVKTEKLDKTENNLIFIERDKPITMTELDRKLDILRDACAFGDNNAAREALRSVVPTYHRPEEVNNQSSGPRIGKAV